MRVTRILHIMVIPVLALVALLSSIHAAVPPIVLVQGLARTPSGDPISDGSYSFQFAIYNDSISGAALWSETQAALPVAGGMFSAALGTVTVLGDTVFGAANRWLEISIGVNPPLPRLRLATSPYAFRVATIDGTTGGLVSGDVTIAGKASIGVGLTNTGAAAFVAGQDNVAGGDWSTIAGGQGNASYGPYSSIGGGQGNVTDNLWTTIGGGAGNRARGYFSTVGGGGGTLVEDSNSAAGDYSCIGGGHSNATHGESNTIAGGVGNITDNYFTSIGGGNHNWAGAGATIGGGFVNAAGGWYSTIGGGSWNRAWGQFAVVAGGGGELITDSNSAIGNYSTVSGGRMNVATGPGAVVAGGWRNRASGRFAVVAGGVDNIAQEKLTFAGGRQALAAHIGAFVWADSLMETVSSPGINTFTVRASGGIWLGTTSIPSIPVGDFLNTSTGAHLTTGGVWTNSSDRNAKENFTDIDRAELLQRIVALPIMRWNYKAEGDSISHVGPMAQDFHALFGVGTDDRTISTIDPSGIALAAIQALHQRNQELEATLKAMQSRIDQLEVNATSMQKK